MFIDKAALLGDCPHEKFDPDYLEEGSGPPVILVHSSMAGARQWSGLIPELSKRRNVRAVNLFGYGGTRAWSGSMRPSLDSFAELVASAVPTSAPTVSLVGHSLGGAVAMRAAAQHLGKRVDRLVLIEPSLFHLLDAYGRHEAYYEILALMEETTRLLSKGALELACARFVDYWRGPGSWSASSEARRGAVAGLISGLPDEWGALLSADGGVGEWRDNLPSRTLLMWFAGTVRPSREVVEILSDACPQWEVATIHEGGHMGPLTHPQLVNPVIRGFLSVP